MILRSTRLSSPDGHVPGGAAAAAWRRTAASTARSSSPPLAPGTMASWRGLPIGEVAVRVLAHLVGDEFDRAAFDALVRDAFNFPAPTVPRGRRPLRARAVPRPDDGVQGLRGAVPRADLRVPAGRARRPRHDPRRHVRRHGQRRGAGVLRRAASEGRRALPGRQGLAVPGSADGDARRKRAGRPRARHVRRLPAPGEAGVPRRRDWRALNLSSANSINIGRLLPQSVYYVASWLDAAGPMPGTWSSPCRAATSAT